MCPMPAPYPREFRDDVVRVARSREDGVTLALSAMERACCLVGVLIVRCGPWAKLTPVMRELVREVVWLLADLNHVGNNLNQVARVLNAVHT